MSASVLRGTSNDANAVADAVSADGLRNCRGSGASPAGALAGERFEPSEQISEDLSVSFPADI